MSFPASYHACNQSSKFYKQSIAVHAPDVEVLQSWNAIHYIACIVGAVLIAAYIYEKAPYMVRLSGSLCVLLWLTELVPMSETPDKAFLGKSPDVLWTLMSTSIWLKNTLKQNTIWIYSVFISTVFIRFWWCKPVNITKDMVSVGFDYLKPVAKRRGRSVCEIVNESLRLKNTLNLPPVYPNGWIPILESRDLKKGDAKSVSALGQSFAVFRGFNGKAYILDAYCPHLGANLSVGGRVKGNCIECPFHSWTFNGDDGACVGIAYADKIPAGVKATTWPCSEVNGTIHVWFNAEKSPPSWDVPVIQEVEDGSWSYRGRTEQVVHCHIQEIPENGADVSHLQPLHSEAFLAGTDPKRFHRKRKLVEHIWDASWNQSTEPEKTHIALLHLKHHINLCNIPIPFSKMEFHIQQIGPAIVHLQIHSSFGRGAFIQTIVPEQPLQQRLIHHLYAEFKFPQWVSSTYLKLENDMVQRDVCMWNNKKYLKNPVLVKEDKKINSFRRWYSQFYSENSPTLQRARESSLEW